MSKCRSKGHMRKGIRSQKGEENMNSVVEVLWETVYPEYLIRNGWKRGNENEKPGGVL